MLKLAHSYQKVVDANSLDGEDDEPVWVVSEQGFLTKVDCHITVVDVFGSFLGENVVSVFLIGNGEVLDAC